MNLENLKKNLAGRGFVVHSFATAAEGSDYVCGAISGETVGIGGSQTIEAMGLYERLGKDNKVYWHWKTPTDKDHFGEFSVYLTSANGVAETGELVNIDGAGNRVSAALYGAKRVVYIISSNKVEPDLAAAIERARNVASPKNAKRLGTKTPCAADGRCHDCRSPERICNAMTIQMGNMKGSKPIEIVLIDEELGA